MHKNKYHTTHYKCYSHKAEMHEQENVYGCHEFKGELLISKNTHCSIHS